MEIETQRGNGVCWTDNHWGRVRRWVTSAIVTLMLSLFATPSPAQAAVETIAPTSTQLICFSAESGCSGAPGYYDGVQPHPFSIKYTYESAQAWCAARQLIWTHLSHIAPYGSFLAFYSCSGWVFAVISASCPTATPAYSFNPASGMCERPVAPVQCPANSSGTAPACVCNAGFEFDAAKTSCVLKCKVDKLTPFPPPNDACSAALENRNSTQAQKNDACGTLTAAMQTGQTCLENKLAAMTPAAIPFVRTGDIRSVAYQAHFRDIWDKMERLVELEADPAKHTACAARRAEIAAEKGCDNAGKCVGACYAPSATQRSHCFRGRPARPDPNGAKHTQGNAIDVSQEATIDPLIAALTGRNPTQTIQQFLDAAPNCNLKWGGTITDNVDEVHFEAR